MFNKRFKYIFFSITFYNFGFVSKFFYIIFLFTFKKMNLQKQENFSVPFEYVLLVIIEQLNAHTKLM